VTFIEQSGVAESGDVILFGAGQAGRLARQSLSPHARVLCFVDNDIRKHGTSVDGLDIRPAAAITDHPSACIVVASLYADEIVGQLLAAGVGWDRIRIVAEAEPLRRARDPFPFGCAAIMICVSMVVAAGVVALFGGW
jgi:hypothetical protein